MRKLLFTIFICMIFLHGCSTTSHVGTIVQSDNGKTTTFTLNSPGKISNEKGEMDTRTTSLLRTITEAVIVKGIEVR